MDLCVPRADCLCTANYDVLGDPGVRSRFAACVRQAGHNQAWVLLSHVLNAAGSYSVLEVNGASGTFYKGDS